MAQSELGDRHRQALADQLLAMGDDELILGHRNSEWCGHAPILEEDIAFANIALDEIGHAVQWYQLLAELEGRDTDAYPNELTYHRDPDDFRCIQLVELPPGDWAFSMLRQYLFDAAEKVRLQALAKSVYGPLRQLAESIGKEEKYHFRHTDAWVERLALGTEESSRRMQGALDELWPYTSQLFAPLPEESTLSDAGILPEGNVLRQQWEEEILPKLEELNLHVHDGEQQAPSRSKHTQHLVPMLQDMQSVARLDPQAKW